MNVSGNTENEVVVMPQSDECTLCVTLKGVVSVPEYEEHFYKPIKSMVESGCKYNLLIHYDPTYVGWDKKAAEMSFQSIIDYGHESRKLAYVNAPDSKMLQVKVAKPLLSGEVRFFDEEELEDALEWVKA
jgi:hypothetical protein